MISKQNFTVIFDDQALFWFTNARVHTQKCKWVSTRSAGMYMRVNYDRLLERSFVLVVISLLQAHPHTHTHRLKRSSHVSILHTPTKTSLTCAFGVRRAVRCRRVAQLDGKSAPAVNLPTHID